MNIRNGDAKGIELLCHTTVRVSGGHDAGQGSPFSRTERWHEAKGRHVQVI